jgi:hypothetical protein
MVVQVYNPSAQRLKKEDHEFKANLDYKQILSQKTKTGLGPRLCGRVPGPRFNPQHHKNKNKIMFMKD